jgi:hypothetical protein
MQHQSQPNDAVQDQRRLFCPFSPAQSEPVEPTQFIDVSSVVLFKVDSKYLKNTMATPTSNTTNAVH